MVKILVKVKGSAKSGNWGHSGIPGHQGGSAPKGQIEVSDLRRSSPHKVDPLSDSSTWENSMSLFPDKRSAAALKEQVVNSLSDVKGLAASEFVHQWAESSNDNDFRSLSIQRDAAEEFGVELSPWQQGKLQDYDRAIEIYTEAAKLSKVYSAAREEILDLEYSDPKYTQALQTIESSKKRLEELGDEVYGRSDIRNYVGMGGGFSDYVPRMSTESERLAPPEVQRKALRTMYENTQKYFADQGITEVIMYRGVNFDNPTIKTGSTVKVRGNALESWSADPKTAGTFGNVVMSVKMPVSRILSTPMTGFGCLKEYEYVILGAEDEVFIPYSDFDINDYEG